MTAAGRVAATLRALLLRPGFLTREYLDHRRTSFISPARLCLGCAISYFALSPVFAALTRTVHPAPAPAIADSCRALHLRVTPLGAIITPEGPGDSLLIADIDTSSLSGRVVAHAGRVACHPWAFEHEVVSLLPALLLLYMPLLAALLQLAYRAREPSYAAHMVFTLHFHAMLFVVLIASEALTTPGNAILSTVVAIAGIVFTSWQYYSGARHAYGGGPTETMWKTTLVGLIYGGAYTVGVVIVLAWILLQT